MQSIIVYRNPIEAAFWEGVTNGSFFPVICGVVVFFAVFLTIHVQVVERFCHNRQAWPSYLNLFVSGCIGCAIIYKMSI